MSHRLRSAALPLGVGLLLGSLACIHSVPPPSSRTALPVTVGYAFDHPYDHGEDPAPDRLVARVSEVLGGRNLPVNTVPAATSMADFSSQRDTRRRFDHLAQLGQTPLYALVETSAVFLTASEGQYRWNVFVKLTVGRKGAGEPPITKEFTLPALLRYDHEQEPEAIDSQADIIADRLGNQMDNLLALQPAPEVTGLLPSPKLKPGEDSIYFVMVDRFANGNKENDGAVDAADPAAWHGGDLQGIIQHLDWLQSLGVRTLWLSPIFKSREDKFFGHGAFHGYWVEDFRELEPRFGTAEDLHALANALHQRGMRLLLDIVLNHTSFDAPLLKQHPDWFHHFGDVKNWNDPLEVVTHDVMGLPDLAQEKAPVKKYLIDNSIKWADASQADGFRLDAVRHVSMEFWRAYNDELRTHMGPDFELLGELLDGDPAVLAHALKEGHFSGLFDFPFHYALMDVFCRDQTPAKLASVLSQDRIYPDPNALVTVLDNHDLPRALTACKGDVERVRHALEFQLTARGTPAFTYGTEVGLTGEKEPQNRGDMRFDGEAPLYDTIQKLLALRHEHEVLRTGQSQILALDSHLLAYSRVTADEAALILVNTADTPRTWRMPEELRPLAFTDVLNRATFQQKEGVPLVAHGVRVLLAAAPRPGSFAGWAEQARTVSRGKGGQRQVSFVPHGVPTDAQTQVYLVGSAPELGAWKAERAVGPLSATGGLAAVLPVGAVAEYKLLLRRPGKEPEWEPGDNHVVFVRLGTGPQVMETGWARAVK